MNLDTEDPYAPDADAITLSLVNPTTAIPHPATASFSLLLIVMDAADMEGKMLSGSVTAKLIDEAAPTCVVHALSLYVYSVAVIVADTAFGICCAADKGIV